MYLVLRSPLLFVLILVYSAVMLAQTADSTTASTTSCGPPSYGCARSDLIKTNNLNPPPNVSGGKNTIVTPSDFKLPIVRATDGTLYENQTMATTLSGSNSDNVFNTDDTYMMVVGDGGWKYPVAFNPTTMKILNTGPWKPGTNEVRWGGPASFSRVNRSVVYLMPGTTTSIPGVVGGNSMTLFAVTLSGTTAISGTGARIYDFGTCPEMPSPYVSGTTPIWHSVMSVSAGDKRVGIAFSNKGGQDTGTDITVYDKTSGQCYRYDTAHAKLCTSTGCAPMSLPDEFTIHEIYMSLDGNYVRIGFSKCIEGGCTEGSGTNPYFWEVGTTNVTRCYVSSHTANCSGHMVEGYTHIYNWTKWPETGKRAFSDPLSYSVVNPTPSLSPINDAHYSNNAADSLDTHPFWATTNGNLHKKYGGAGCNTTGNIYEGCTFPGPLYGEIFGIKQNGGYVRAAHSYNSNSSTTNFDCSNTIGAVSQTGRFFAWTSDWLTTLGKDHTGHPRCDVFIVNLAAAQGAVN